MGERVGQKLIGTHGWWLSVALIEYWKARGQPEYMVVRIPELNDFYSHWGFWRSAWVVLRYPIVLTSSYCQKHMADELIIRDD